MEAFNLKSQYNLLIGYSGFEIVDSWVEITLDDTPSTGNLNWRPDSGAIEITSSPWIVTTTFLIK